MADDWDEVSADGWSAAKDALFIGPCPHDWLFQRVAGVVHHGGAGRHPLYPELSPRTEATVCETDEI
jgi:hypothetical protein